VTASEHRVTTARRPGADASRLDFLDALRGLAVGLVLLQHVGEMVSPAVRGLAEHGVQLGQLGVMLFFLCSGFIIPASLERGAGTSGRPEAVRRFWRSRFFRLYPLYWVSLVGALLLSVTLAPTSAEPLGPLDWLVNATMLQGLAGSPHALGLYWTLTLELIFYAVMSGLLLAGWHRRSVALSLGGSGACLLAAVLAEPVLGRPAPLALFCLTTMFTGTVFHRWHRGDVALRTLAGCVGAALVAGTVLLFAVLAGREQPGFGGSRSLVPMLTAWLGAYLIFCTVVALRGRPMPRALRRLGALSYSVYLLQPLVLVAVPAVPGSPWLSAAVWVAVILVASSWTHRWIELPAVRWGRRARPTVLAAVIPVPRRATPSHEFRLAAGQ
jgi:peptidoglycan/LPS O-acetylase OafA/YrhL